MGEGKGRGEEGKGEEGSGVRGEEGTGEREGKGKGYPERKSWLRPWAAFSHFCLDKCEIWHGGADRRAKLHVYRGNVSLLRGEKTIFGPLSKNNTDMAAERAGLPVIIFFSGLRVMKQA